MTSDRRDEKSAIEKHQKVFRGNKLIQNEKIGAKWLVTDFIDFVEICNQ